MSTIMFLWDLSTVFGKLGNKNIFKTVSCIQNRHKILKVWRQDTSNDISLSPVKRGDIGFSFSVCQSVHLSVRVSVQAISPKVLNGKFLNFTYG